MKETGQSNHRENLTEQKDKQRKIKTIQISATNRGFPAMWESGGGLSNTGSSQIITGRQGEPRRPVFVRNRGNLACKEHALITVHEGFYFIKVGRHHDDYSISISRIVRTNVRDIDGEKWEATADIELVNTFEDNNWEKPLDQKLEKAVAAARKKTQEYHCRSPYFIDFSERKKSSSTEDRKRTDAAIKKQDENRARLREKIAADKATAQAEAEAVSRAAKENGLADRLNIINEKLATLENYQLIELGDTHYKWGWQKKLYTEQNIANIEEFVESKLAEKAEAETKKKLRQEFEPKYEDLKARAEKLDLELGFADDFIRIGKNYYYDPYSEESRTKIETYIATTEAAAKDAEAAAQAEARYQELKAEAVKQELPQNIEIWHRRGGSTNAGEGWVIQADGRDREPTRKPSRDGNKLWEQILSGEVVLKWSKAYTAAPHEFQVIHLPPEGLTKEQKLRIKEIENEIAEEWKGRTGLASGKNSPDIGNGWNLNK